MILWIILNFIIDAILRHIINGKIKMLSLLSIYPFLIQLCHTFTLYWLSIRLHSLINATPCFLPFLYFCVTDKCTISCNNTLFSFSSYPTILLLILMVRFLTGRFLSISNSNMPTIVLKLLLRNPILALFQFPVKIHPVVFVKLHLQVFLRYLHIVDEFVLLAGWCPKESGQ